MAISLKNVESLIPELLKSQPHGLELYQKLKLSGMTEDVGMFSITFKFAGADEMFVCNLPQSISALMKNMVPSVTKDLCTKIVLATVIKAGDWKFGVEPTPVAELEPLLAAEPAPTKLKKAPKPKTEEKPSPFLKTEASAAVSKAQLEKPLRLGQAEAVGQKVYGTSAGSFYTTLAVGKINVACKLGPSSVSLRVEGRTDMELKSIRKELETMGFEYKTADSGHPYMSMHLQCEKIPRSRVIGAVLLSMPGRFTQLVHGKEEIE